MLNAEIFADHFTKLLKDFKTKKYLLAVSGGLDSSVLAYLFHQINLSFDVAHCNFHLRGVESNLDMEFVKSIPYLSNSKIFIKEFDTFAEQKDSKRSIEMVARELRYQWFEELAHDYDYIVTAHHADDNAETLLLNLTRGTGLKGLTAIPTFNNKIIRPLLPFTAEEIKNFATENQIPFRTDQTNFSTQFHRNKIRHQIIPVLKTINPKVIDTFSQNIEIFKSQYDFFSDSINPLKKAYLEQKNKKYHISIDKLLLEKHGRLILYEILTDFNFNSTVIYNIFNRLGTQSGKYFYSPTHQLLKNRKELIISEKKEEKAINIVINDIKELKNYGFSVELYKNSSKITFSDDKKTIYIDKNKLVFPLYIRKWQAGDYFHPYGLTGKKKLSDFFTDNKINRLKKKEIPILWSRDKIVWIVGFAADHRFAIESKKTKEYYVIRQICENSEFLS